MDRFLPSSLSGRGTRVRLSTWLRSACLAALAVVALAQKQTPTATAEPRGNNPGAVTTPVGPFFEPGQPFFHTQADLGADNFVVRGILLPLRSGHVVLFDQELLRVAGIWLAPAGQPPVTERTMAQISYRRPRAKVASEHPQPTGPRLLVTGMHPGAATETAALGVDPRPPGRDGDMGRGPLPDAVARFEQLALGGDTAVLSYRIGPTAVQEWFEARGEGGAARVLRHFAIAPHAAPLHLTIGRVSGPWQLEGPARALATGSDGLPVAAWHNLSSASLSIVKDELIVTIAPADAPQRFTVTLAMGAAEPSPTADSTPTPEPPASSPALRWKDGVTAPAQLAKVRQNGWALDQLAVPETNPWQRRIRPADLAFLSDDEAAVVTYDGDIWKVSGLADPDLAQVTWRRYASGLHEPLAIAAPAPGVVQVWTKNGLIRLRDRDGNGEADTFENFNDQVIQSQSTRSFPLDMALGPDGSTFVSQGGIVDSSGIKSGGAGTPHAGAVVKISPDGRSSRLFARAAREPFVTVNPQTGVVTGTDQQGHFIPASAAYLFREGDAFGFPQTTPDKLTPPLAWIPHAQDTSSTSQVWTSAKDFGAWGNRLLHLSYGRGRLFLITPDLEAPTPQGATIPLGLETDLPLLHARVAPAGGAVWLAGFQIWGTRTTTMWALARLRFDATSPIVTPVAARSNAHGVVLEFARPLDPASVQPEAVRVRGWNYKRSAEYGSGYYQWNGDPGTEDLGVSQTVLSADGKSVFVHLPKLAPLAQLEVKHAFKFADDGAETQGIAFFTVHQLHDTDLAPAGFAHVDLSRRDVVAVSRLAEESSPEQGREIAVQFGCAACHFVDPTTQTALAPTWRNLYRSRRQFVDGTSTLANEDYLREKILEPQKRRLTTGVVEMPSYQGTLTDSQIDSLIMYIKTLAQSQSSEEAK